MAFRKVGGGGGGSGSPGGSNVTLENITGGPLSTTKGGTGINVSNFEELRSHLLVNSTDPKDSVLTYCSNTIHQANSTIQRINSSTANIPTGVDDGVVTKVGNDQTLIDLATGHTWHRTHTSTDGTWGTPVDATTDDDFTEITNGAEMRAMSGGDVKYTSTSALLPSFTDNSKPAKVILSRVTTSGNYFIACDRNNMWWGQATLTGTFSITWHWEGNSHVPAGFEYTGGENDEALIPAGSSAILSGNTRIPGENYITLLVSHTATGNTSSEYNGYYIDDDSGATFKKSTNTRSYSIGPGDWARTKADIDGIADTIITADQQSGEPVFHGIIPEISSMGFPDYTFKTTNATMAPGYAAFVESSRTLWVYHQTKDIHLSDLFAVDFEVEIHKDASNYIRGVFDDVRTFDLGDITFTGGVFRIADFQKVGTINADDKVEIKGHKSVITKNDTIVPVNLGLDHGDSEKNKVITMKGTGDNAGEAFDSGFLTPQNMNISTALASNRIIAGNSTGDGFIAAPAANVGLVKQVLMLRSNTTGSGDGTRLDSVGITRKTWKNSENMHTPTWTIQNKSTDWLVVNCGGLYYFGQITAQPICADLELWVRWKQGTETWTNWGNDNAGERQGSNITTGTRVSAVATGGDRLQVVKLYAGGSGGNSHVDCAIPTGRRFIKLSDLPSDITDNDEVQFTVGFAKQTPSPDFLVRNFFMTIEILDGGRVSANY